MHHSEGGQVIFVDKRVFRKEQSHRWNDVRESASLLLNSDTELFQVESLHQVYGDTAVDRRHYQNSNA